jgi:3-oxoacyl-(acyl-carrier-protein) synthase
MGCVCAAGFCLEVCLETLASGKRGPADPTRFTNDHGRSYPVFEIPQKFFMCEGMSDESKSLTFRFALHATWQALWQARLNATHLGKARVGVCLGTSVGASLNFLDFYREHRAHTTPDLTPIHRYLTSNPALALAQKLGATGPVQTIVNACSSGADAIGMGTAWIRQGLCDVVIAGGADELSQVTYNGFIRLMIADQNACKPFDANRKGLNLGEGAGIVILESPAFMSKHKACEHATICGYGTAADAHHLTAPHPEGLGLKKAIAEALQQAGLGTRNIAFINAHGTGTLNNDRAEAAVFKELFLGKPIVATKGVTGHTLGAAGAIEAVFTIAHLAAGKIPASPGFERPDPELGVAPTSRPKTIRGKVAMSQSLAFGGNNSVLIIRKGRDV